MPINNLATLTGNQNFMKDSKIVVIVNQSHDTTKTNRKCRPIY